MELSARHLALASLAGGFLALVFSLVFGNLLLLAFAAALFLLSLVAQRFGAVLLPFVLKGLRVVETRGGWLLDGDVAVQKDGSRYLASAFLEVDVSFSPSLHSSEANASYAAAFERALCSLPFPAQFSLLVYPLDTEAYRQEVLTKRMEVELALGRLKKVERPDVAALAQQERRLAMCSRLLDRLTAGEKPLEAFYFVCTAAEGFSEAQASGRARLQARELKAVLSNALNADVRGLQGDALRRCIDWRVAMPPSVGSYLDVV